MAHNGVHNITELAAEAADAPSEPAALKRALGLRDLFFLYVACIVSLSSITQVAQFGYGSLALYLLAIGAFLVPSAIMVADLSARIPEEGGFYLWTRQAFGDFHGFICAWSYYLANIVWLPTVSLLIANSMLFLVDGAGERLGESLVYNAGLSLLILWGVTGLNLIGLDRAKWINTASTLATGAVMACMIVLGGMALAHSGLPEVKPADFLPVFDTDLLGYFALAAFCFGGLELAPVMSGEIQQPRRNVPRAIVLSSIAVGAVYIVVTLVLVMLAPAGEIDIISGMAEEFRRASERLEVPELGAFGILCVGVSTLGLFGSWLTGTARIPFVIGIAHYLPEGFGRVHTRYGSPWVSLLAQALLLTLLMLAAAAGSTVKEAFLVLLDMSIILYFLPFLYMFAAHVRHVKRQTGTALFPGLGGRPALLWLVAGAGFTTTLVSLLVSVVPTRDVDQPGLFVVKVVGGAFLLIAIGLLIYLAERRAHARDAALAGA